MESIVNIDKNIVLWLNKWSGSLYILDRASEVIVGDYFVPVCIGLLLILMWFLGRTPMDRTTHQFCVLKALISLGFANLSILILNQHIFRERPFMDLDVTVLFYHPTDSSFPANPAAVAFSVAMSVWRTDKKIGALIWGLAILWSLCRVYAGVFYPTDILAGAFIGIAMSFLVSWAFHRLEPLPSRVINVLRRFYVA